MNDIPGKFAQYIEYRKINKPSPYPPIMKDQDGKEITMKRLLVTVLVLAATLSATCGETVRLKATADIWLSAANEKESNSSAGRSTRFKLKSIQEMAAIRFDASPARGREILRATLMMRRASSDMLRYLRVSTVNQDWAEGSGTESYGPADGATYRFADAGAAIPWAWPGSEFCDVIMTSGNTLATWAERKEMPDGWIAVSLSPELVQALLAGDSDGLAVMDGGNLAYFNNYLYSAQSKGNEPYVEVELGNPLTEAPDKPIVNAVPAPDHARLNAGALRLTFAEAKNVFCWRVLLNGRPVERWRLKHPAAKGPTVIVLEDLTPSQQCEIEVVAVSPAGIGSLPVKLSALASGALPKGPELPAAQTPVGSVATPAATGNMKVWALPALVKVNPEKAEAMLDDMEKGDTNAVWDGKTVRLFGARSETVSFQVCIERLGPESLKGVKVNMQDFVGPGDLTIGATEIDLFRNWYAKNANGQWQPAYCIPLAQGEALEIPDLLRGIDTQENQTLYVDVFIPKDASPGIYLGTLAVEADGTEAAAIPVEIEVFDFALPDRLSFWPELNAYRIPAGFTDYWRLAHQHRCVANFWRFTPDLNGTGRNIKVDWTQYDKDVGPILTGEAFKDLRRPGVPPEVMYLPFQDSWPTPLSKETYQYDGYWPGRGEDVKWITEHYMEAPYIGNGLSQGYKEAFLAVERQFIDHFKEKGYTQTEMQCFFGGKNTHRINYGANMWWTTDEPYHWDDWLALQFFCRLWTLGRGSANPSLWAARGDISRPNWQGRVMEGALDCEYIGGFNSPPTYQRGRRLTEDTDVEIRTYGSANKDTESNTRSVVWLLNDWTNGANASLPWQTLGDEEALDVGDIAAGGGNALLVPGNRFGQPVVADMRLKALRDGQQLIEYLVELGKRYDLNREQVQVLVLQFSTLKTREISELRHAVAELIVKRPEAKPEEPATDTTGIYDVESFEGLIIYPNPTSGLFTIDIDNQIFGELTIRIFDQDGKETLNTKSDKTTSHLSVQIDLSRQAKGIYFISAHINRQISNKKIILLNNM